MNCFLLLLVLNSINVFTVQEVQEEGEIAIDSPGFVFSPIISPDEYSLGIVTFDEAGIRF